MLQATWLLLYCPYRILTGTPLGYPVVALSGRDLAPLVLMEQLLHKFQHLVHGADVRVGPLKPCIWAWVVADSISLTAFSHIPTGPALLHP